MNDKQLSVHYKLGSAIGLLEIIGEAIESGRITREKEYFQNLIKKTLSTIDPPGESQIRPIPKIKTTGE